MSSHSPACSGWARMPAHPDPERETVTAATCADCGEQVGTITLTPMDAPSVSGEHCGKPVSTGLGTLPCAAAAGHIHGCTLVTPA